MVGDLTMVAEKPAQENQPIGMITLDALMALCKIGNEANVAFIKLGDLEIQFKPKYDSLSSSFKTPEPEYHLPQQKPVTDEDILMNPYAGLNNG